MKDIDRLSAEELRIEIAKAKGWVVWKITNHAYNMRYPMPPEIINIPGWVVADEWQDLYWQEDSPNWPDDISAAWELVEEMEADGMYPQIFTCPSSAKWCSGYLIIDQAWMQFESDTAPLAICCAWLTWKRGEG